MEFLQQNDLLLAMVEEGKWEADVKKIKQLLGQPASAASSNNGSLALEDSSCAGVHEPAMPYPGPKAMKSSTKWIIAGVIIFASFILMSLFILIAGELLSDGLGATATILFSVLLWLPMILSSLACFIIGFLKMGNNK